MIRPTPGNSLENQAGGGARNGLHLIQLNGTFQSEWQDQLRERGVDLLQYVPDDTFIARFNRVPPGELKKLPFVRWTGKYKAEHKVHKSMAQAAAQRKAGELSGVSVLLNSAASAQEVAQVKQLLRTIRQESKLHFGTVLRGAIPAAQIAALAESEAVLWIEPEFRPKLVDEIAAKIVAGDGGRNRTVMQNLGFDGEGVTVAVADSGLHTGNAATMHPDLFGRVRGFFYYGALTDAADEHSHGTHVAGIIAGNGATGEADYSDALYGLGVAPQASIIAQRLFDGEGNYEPPPSFEVLTHDAVRSGADIGSNSWGDDTQGRYDISAMEFDALVRDADTGTAGDQPYILEFSAGNAGPGFQTIGSPAVAKNVIATGASENDRPDFFIYADGPDVMADFSSRGPCEDGRIKPDLVAPGTWIASLRSPLGNDEFAWADISYYYLYQGGTSQAGPQVSGAAADFVQYYFATTGTKPSPALVKAALINSAIDMDDSIDTPPVPNGDEGWGRVDLTELIGSPRTYLFLDQTQLLRTSQIYEQRIVIASRDEALKVTLAYTDVPGFPGVIPALVNDLDLEVEGPSGELYLGNQFERGESIAGSSAADRFNNVEGVHLSEPEPGEYVVRVRGRNVVRDARRDTPAVDQDFALVISADIPPPGTPFLFLDRPAYTAPSEIRIKLIDSALGPSNALVTVKSTTEQTAEPVTLRAATSGSFTGRIATATGPAAIDGRLQIAHSDLIQVSFTHSGLGQTATATALGDLLPPVISNVSVTNRFGRTLITWDTDEPSTSIVRFGTNSSLGSAQTNLARVESHEVSLKDLRVGTRYYFIVSSADAAGNAATNSDGQLSFIAAGAPTLLLVDNYYDDGIWTFVPLSVYTNTLNAIGTSYEVWDAQEIGHTPTFDEMRPFRIVMWRLSDSILVPSTIEVTEQAAIRQYLAGGGAFFLAAMEQLSRITSSFKQDVLHVQSFNEDAQVPEILGVTGNPVTAGIDMVLDYSLYEDELHYGFGIPTDISDTFTPTADAASLLLESQTRQLAGVMYPRIGQVSTGRVAFLSFPLDAVPTNGVAPNSRVALMRNVINFLAPGQGGSEIHFDSSAYTIPSLVTIEVADIDLAGTSNTTVKVHSDSVTNRITLSLAETIPPGLFRGSITLTNTGVFAPNHLQARNGDRIHAEYFDQSGNISITTTALVDTVKPIISGIFSNADYVQATISWDTSKDTDGLVQFGESKFLGRTGYDPDFNTYHEITITGLLPDKDYYYQVVSRDLAGNTVVDDNGGDFYLLHTLIPIRPPYSDGFDEGSSHWDVSSESSSTDWTLGVPRNGQLAYSEPNSWCSSINGAESDQIDTFLISPSIDLTGASAAKFTFWHSYDFTDPTGDDIYQEGVVLIFTNQVTDPEVLGEFVDDSGGWYPEQLDLSRYVGNVVNLVWWHTLLSFERSPRVGWLIDDVSLTTTPLPPRLQIDRRGTNVVLSWPADDPSWFLVSKRFLATNTLWSAVAESPNLVNGRYYVTNAASGFARFYELSKTPGAPALSIALAGANLVTLSWATNSLNYILQSSDSMMPTHWTNMNNSPYINGNQQSVTVPKSGKVRFFRLVPP